MLEVAAVREAATPHQTLLVADAMTGQDAVNVAKAFGERAGVTGIVLTRVDGDARGGAALSMRAITGKPIVLIGTGEKIDALEPFHPGPHRRPHPRHGRRRQPGRARRRDRRPGRGREARRQDARRASSTSTISPRQLRQIRRMGGMSGMLGMLPGIGKIKKQIDDANIDESIIKRQEAIISSMTKSERRTRSC